MALKDLVATTAHMTEEAIEQIVADYIRYDVSELALVLTPEASRLGNREKILVYLTGLHGWQFVTDHPPAVDARPSELEAVLGIPGGSLRPTLRDLADSHFLSDRDGRYSVRPSSFAAVESLLKREGGKKPATARRRKATSRSERLDDDAHAVSEEAADTEPVRRRPAAPGLASRFATYVERGFFNEPRTLADVQRRLRKDGIIVPQTSLPSYLLTAVRTGQLEREHMEIDGRLVWVYAASEHTKTK